MSIDGPKLSFAKMSGLFSRSVPHARFTDFRSKSTSKPFTAFNRNQGADAATAADLSLIRHIQDRFLYFKLGRRRKNY